MRNMCTIENGPGRGQRSVYYQNLDFLQDHSGSSVGCDFFRRINLETSLESLLRSNHVCVKM